MTMGTGSGRTLKGEQFELDWDTMVALRMIEDISGGLIVHDYMKEPWQE